MRFFNIICSLYFLFKFFSCENNSILPKQDAYLRIEFNEPNYLIHKSQNSKINFLYNSSSSSIESISARTINLDYKKFVKVDKNLQRPSDVQHLLGNCSQAKKILKWKPKYNFEGLVRDMVKADLEFVEKYGY